MVMYFLSFIYTQLKCVPFFTIVIALTVNGQKAKYDSMPAHSSKPSRKPDHYTANSLDDANLDNETEITPPVRHVARDDDGDTQAELTPKVAVLLHSFESTLQSAACWRRGEIPPDVSFAHLWRTTRLAVLLVLVADSLVLFLD
jgi:hypothetical protein